MKRVIVAAMSLALSVMGIAAGCDDGEDLVASPQDAGVAGEASVTPEGGGDSAKPAEAGADAGPDSDAADGAPLTPKAPWALITVNQQTNSELIAYSLTNHAVDGVLAFPDFIGYTTTDSLGRIFLLEQSTDRVVELDPLAPWKERASWDVSLARAGDAGANYADPILVVPVSTGKAYVLRFNRNSIAVIDDSVKADASTPTKSIDISSFYNPGDTDTSVDPVGAVKHGNIVYVLLANLDLNNVDPKGYFTICSATSPKIIAIDTLTDTVTSVLDGGVGSADGGTQVLGYNPTFGGLLLDATRNRLLVVNGGCNDATGDGGKGPMQRSQIDAVDLTTGAVTKLLDLATEGYPSSVLRLSDDEVVLGLDFYSLKRWNVTQSTLSASLADSVSAVTSDKMGNLLVVQDNSFAFDGGTRDLVEVPLDGGALRKITVVPATGGFAGALDFASGQ